MTGRHKTMANWKLYAVAALVWLFLAALNASDLPETSGSIERIETVLNNQ